MINKKFYWTLGIEVSINNIDIIKGWHNILYLKKHIKVTVHQTIIIEVLTVCFERSISDFRSLFVCFIVCSSSIRSSTNDINWIKTVKEKKSEKMLKMETQNQLNQWRPDILHYWWQNSQKRGILFAHQNKNALSTS